MSKRVLIIDDEDDIREIVEIALQQTAGWQTLGAGSADDGLVRARVDLPDAILLDITMPDMDGMTALARLKADERTAAIPVILLTATVRVTMAVLAGQAAGLILKPFDPMTLARQIGEILGWQLPAPESLNSSDSQNLDVAH